MELDELAGAPWEFVWLEVAKNLHAGPETLSRLVPAQAESWADQDRIAALAENPITRPEDLGRCVRLLIGYLDGGRPVNAFRAGVALARNPLTPFGELKALLRHSKTGIEFRKVVARETSRPDVLLELANDPSPRVRGHAERRRGP